MFELFDRYKDLTDLSALKEFSALPLRKSMRVNTLKHSIADFTSWAKEKDWQLTPVPWCKEAFFIDRQDRSEALGKDLLHLLGHVYMQEAASMLPPELLQPQLGEMVLDMSAAPGSKTSQMGAKMQGRGVIVANDVQEKRLWTLKAALHRSGTHNNIIIKKVGQWYAKHMTERFDRVLCDAPCTAQGTVRKDSDALSYCSTENIEKMARLQFQLLESAVHATKVGGRIVYSTCTLTPEENEGVVLQMLQAYPQLEIVDPESLNIAPEGFWRQAIEDSYKIQQTFSDPSTFNPLLRLWPQTYDTEGFFCAVFQKNAPTKDVTTMEYKPFHERELRKSARQEIENAVTKQFGTSFLDPQDRLFESDSGTLTLSTQEVAHCTIPVTDFSLGIPYGKKLKDGRIKVDHELISLRGQRAKINVLPLSEDLLADLFAGKDIEAQSEHPGQVILTYKSFPIGLGLDINGKIKNNLPRWMVQMKSA